MFCSNCGQQVPEGATCVCQTNTQPQAAVPQAPAPTLCPKCNAAIPAGGMACTACGTPVNTGGGSAIKLPENFNVNNAIKISKDIAGKAGISVHRLYIAIAAVLGILSSLLPWYGMKESFWGITARATVNAFRAKATSMGFSVSEAHVLGIIIFILFIAVIALCFLENRIEPLKKNGKFAFAGGGGFIFLLTIISIAVNSSDYGGIKIGVIFVLLFSAAIAALPFVKKLEDL